MNDFKCNRCFTPFSSQKTLSKHNKNTEGEDIYTTIEKQFKNYPAFASEIDKKLFINVKLFGIV